MINMVHSNTTHCIAYDTTQNGYDTECRVTFTHNPQQSSIYKRSIYKRSALHTPEHPLSHTITSLHTHQDISPNTYQNISPHTPNISLHTPEHPSKHTRTALHHNTHYQHLNTIITLTTPLPRILPQLVQYP